MMAHLSLTLLEPPEITLDGKPITGSAPNKARALLAYLAVEADRPHRRDALATLLWPNYPDRAARTNLRRALYNLRRTTGDRDAHPPFLLITRESIQFNSASDCWVDVAAFSDLVAPRAPREPSTGQLEEAVALYRGPFLEGFSLRDSPGFDDWTLLTQERLHRQALTALQRLTEHYERQGQLEWASEMARRQVELEPWQEEAHRALMRLLALRGLRTAALHQYQTCERVLREELGVAPDPETRALYTAIRERQVRPPPAPSDAIPDRPLPLLPTDLAEQPPATRRETPGERRIVTILYSEVKNATSIAEHLDPEELMDIMQGALDLLIQPIARYEGTVARLMGDAVLALFGAPIAREDDAERACRAALQIMEGTRGYAARLEQGRGLVEFNVRVVIHAGLVTVGEVGSDPRVEYTAMGDAVNVASGLEEVAEPGMVLITEDTHRLIAPLFQTEPLGPVQVRGRSEPVAMYRVLSPRDVAGKGRGIAGLASPLVGRETEIQGLRDALQRLQMGVGGIVTIVGEAGIGKSRLVTELWKGTTSDDLQWVEGRCLSYGSSTAFLPWVDMLCGLLGASADDPPLGVLGELRRWVQGLCPDHFDEVYPYLGRMLSLPLEEEVEARLRQLEPEGLQVLTFRAVERAVEAASSERPLVLVCEDLHWADPTSLQLLEHLLGLADRVSLLLICAFRPHREHGCWAIRETAARLYPHRHVDLYLGPLSSADSEALVGHLLHVDALPRSLRTRILDHAEGNPFYVEEVIRSLIDSEVIVYEEATAQWQAAQRVKDIAIPDTLQGVLIARIDRLPEEARRVLQIASVIGWIFLHRVLAAIAEGGELDANLLTLQREEMIRERARVPEREYIFKHHLTQEAVYEGLLRRERRQLHRQVAEAWERLFPDRVEEQLGLLAHHWESAGEREMAGDYLRRAGEQAAAQFANAEAAGYFTRALDLTPQENLTLRYDLLLARERVCDLQGAREPQTEDLAALEMLAVALGDDRRRTEVSLRRAHYGIQTSNYPAAMAAAQETIGLARSIGDTYLEASAHLQSGRVLYTLGDYADSQRSLERALSLAREAGASAGLRTNPQAVGSADLLRRLEARCLLQIGVVCGYQDDQDRAASFYRQVLRLSRELGDQDTEASALRLLGGALMSQGEYDRAGMHLRQSFEIFRQLGHRHEAAWALADSGWLRYLLGDYDGARLCYEQFLSTVRETRHARGVSWGLGDLAFITLRLGDAEQAQEYAQEGLQVGIQAGHRGVQALALMSLGHALGDLARLDEAPEAFQRALDLWRQLGSQNGAMICLAALARISLTQGNLAAAQDHVEEILSYLETGSLNLGYFPLRIYLTCYRVLRANGDPRADDVLQMAHTLLQELAAKISNEGERRSFLENVEEHREIVREYARVASGVVEDE
jgi:DNA-binding SARP family transcriptional activator/class 3 adenylate cyclase/tetratricopeptide (TPR) repeat protein